MALSSKIYNDSGHSPKIYLYLWFLYPVLYPFYIFKSGLPQPSDFILAVLIGISIFQGWKIRNKQVGTVISYLEAFVIYVIIVNTIWFFFIDQTNEKPFPSIFHSLFYIYNYFAFKLGLLLYQRYKTSFLRITAISLGSAMIIQVVAAFLTGQLTSREPLFFNNPNQLGYFALLTGTLLIVITTVNRINLVFQLASYFSFFTLCLLSASKAAMGGSIILIMLALINQGLISFRSFVLFTAVIAVSYYYVSESTKGQELFNYSYNRFETIGQSNDDSAQGRGYDRIWNDPEYLILGAGEGGYYRFDTAIENHEIHSTFGTILFCYGIVGFILFMRFFTSLFKDGKRIYLLYLFPVLIYSITHQGLRATLFWVLLSIVLQLNYMYRVKERLRRLYQLKFRREKLKYKHVDHIANG